MPVRWLRLALADLDGIYRYIVQINPDAAGRMVNQIWNSGEALGHHPNMGRAGRVDGTRELVTKESNYIIPYRVMKGQVEILRVLHGAMRWPEQF